MLLAETHYKELQIDDIYHKIINNERISCDDALRLFSCPDIVALGNLAHYKRTELHGNDVYYVRNQHINYTNICINNCTFCAYAKELGEKGSFQLSIDTILEKIINNTDSTQEIHIVGGCHPKIPLSFFEELLKKISEMKPEAILKCFTAVEIEHFAKIENISPKEVLMRLKACGLRMLPGGGAEIFTESIREQICAKKSSTKSWLAIHETAHELGIKTNATMLFGHIEKREHRIEHLDLLRKQQDKSSGFTCFIPLPFQTENNELSHITALTGLEILRTIAVSRLMLDNIAHIKAYWVMLSVKLAQAALYYGANDLDGTIIEEKIGHTAGAKSEQALTVQELENMITRCGFNAVERNSLFQIVSK